MYSPLLELPGAVPGTVPDAGVAWHYGDPLGEQRETAASAGWSDRSHRDVLTVSGPDRLTWLHTLLSQHLAELAPHTPTQALLLDANGRVEEHLQVIDDGERTWLDLEPGRGPGLRDYLERMKFWSQVEVEAPEVAVVSVLGPAARAVVTAAEPATVISRATTWPAGGGFDLLVARSDLALAAAKLSAAGARPLGSWGFEALRVAAGVARLGMDTDDKTIPHEVGWIGSAVHLRKGCYRGQETVARVHKLGKPPRRLALLHLDGSEVSLPPHGAGIVPAESVDGEGSSTARQIGWIGTPVRHWELGPLALAILKRQVADDALLTVIGTGRGTAASIQQVEVGL